MTNKTIIKYSFMIFALIIMCNFTTLAQNKDCSQTSDTDIVLAVYEKLKVKYSAERKNINVTSVNGVVKLDGWVASKTTKKKIESLVKKVKCVKQLNSELTVGKGGGCAIGQKECGGTCISEKEPCNICLIENNAPGCLQTETKPKN